MIAFTIVGIDVEKYAATPALTVRVRVDESSGVAVHALALRCQIRIDPQRRSYEDSEAAGLSDLFGDRARWRDTLRPFLWAHTSAVVPGFSGSSEISMPLPITYDFDVIAAKYLHAVRVGDVPLSLMFSGTAFLRGNNGFQVQQIPWDTDQAYLMPVRIWREAMDQFFPGSGWIRVSRDTLDALVRLKSELGLPSWDETFAALLESPAGLIGAGRSGVPAVVQQP